MKGLTRSLGRAAPTLAKIVKQRVKARAVALSIDGATGVGFGTAVIGDLPAGNILFLGAVAYVQITEASAGIDATFDGDFSIGTAPTADATLSGSEVDIVASTALGAATGSVSPRARGTHAVAGTGTVLDNTDGSLELNLNVLIDDANISADDAVAAADVDLELSYVVLMDD
ncbi:MAG TPA: hypothetical protein VFW95_08610 [Candidatus Limnocylindria bacterium]|nr:hypothetical protein [Candidatus Limnocylindria bacterium]